MGTHDVLGRPAQCVYLDAAKMRELRATPTDGSQDAAVANAAGFLMKETVKDIREAADQDILIQTADFATSGEYMPESDDIATRCYCPYRPMLKDMYAKDCTSGCGNKLTHLDGFFTSLEGQATSRIYSTMTEEGDVANCKSWGRIALAKTNIDMQAKGGTLQERLNLASAARKTVDASVLNDNSRVAVGDADGVSYAVNDDGVRIVADYAAPGTNVDRTPQAAFVFDWGLAFDEQYFHIKRYLLTGIGAAVAMVFVIMAMLIAHPVGAIVATAMIVIIEVEVIGLLGLASLKLNAITLINLIMIIGIAVEFVAHITRAAVLPPPGDKSAKSSAERAVYALYEMGPPVLNGAMSTLLAVICIAASSFVYFVKYFFGMYALTIVVCSWNSLVILPILLSFIVPPLAGANGAEVVPDDIPKPEEITPDGPSEVSVQAYVITPDGPSEVSVQAYSTVESTASVVT